MLFRSNLLKIGDGINNWSNLNNHNHTSSNITDFASSVSGLLPVTNLLAGSYIGLSQTGSSFTVSATGLQPSGNYSLVGHSHNTTDIIGLSPAIDDRVITYLNSINGVSFQFLAKIIILYNSSFDLNATSTIPRENIYIFNTGSENYGLILPDAINNQSTFTLKNNTSGTIYYKTINNQTIDGNTIIGLNRRYMSITVVSDGSNWIII